MGEFFKFLNQNPMLLAALLSIVAFPMGLLLTLIVAKRYLFTNAGSALKSGFETYLGLYKQHTEAEVKIEERLRELVDKMEEMLAHNFDTKQFFDARIDHVVEKIDDMSDKINTIVRVMPKREGDTFTLPEEGTTNEKRHQDSRRSDC